MSTKPKKPKARRMYCHAESLRCKSMVAVYCYKDKQASIKDPVAVLDLSDEAALIDALAQAWVAAISKSLRLKVPMLASDHTRAHARAALTALGVLPKRRGK